MSFDRVLGQGRAKEFVQTALRRGRLGHAYLFSGPDGVGKTLFAIELAKVLLCRSGSEQACDQCPDCRMADHGQHPDLHITEAMGVSRVIKIDQAREVRRILHLMPVQADRRIVILREAERMAEPAGNALLKTLEEPAAFALLILTSAQPGVLLPTIRSRCQEIRFGPLSPDQVRQVLSDQPAYGDEEVQFAAAFAEGSPGRAIQVIESGCFEIFDGVVNGMFQLPGGDLFALSDEIREWTRSVSRALEPQRERLRELLRLLSCAYRDVLLLRVAGSKGAPCRSGQGEAPARFAERMRPDRLLRILDAMWEARRQTDANAAINLILENLLGRVAELQAA